MVYMDYYGLKGLNLYCDPYWSFISIDRDPYGDVTRELFPFILLTKFYKSVYIFINFISLLN